jgi:ABC-type bacteriocin/lantibiotic exporter with double-glycine peptidase domain
MAIIVVLFTAATVTQPDNTGEAPNCGCYALWLAVCRLGQAAELADVQAVIRRTDDKGTTLLDLKRGAESMGLHAQGYSVKGQDQLVSLPLPAILPVRVRDSRGEIVPHFVVLLHVRRDHVTVVDPPNPAQAWSYEHLGHVWEGPALAISNSGELPQADSV